MPPEDEIRYGTLKLNDDNNSICCHPYATYEIVTTDALSPMLVIDNSKYDNGEKTMNVVKDKIFYRDKENNFFVSERTLKHFSEMLKVTSFDVIELEFDNLEDFKSKLYLSKHTDYIKYWFEYDEIKNLPLLYAGTNFQETFVNIELNEKDFISKLKKFSFEYNQQNFDNCFSEEKSQILNKLREGIFANNKY